MGIERLIDRITARVVTSLKARGIRDRRVYNDARRRAGNYSLNRLEGLISSYHVQDDDERRGYIRNWLDRAEVVAGTSPSGLRRTDADKVAAAARPQPHEVAWFILRRGE